MLVVFHCYFRPLELLQVTGADIWVSRNGKAASVTLMNTKTSKTKGPETVALDDPAVIWWLMRFRPQGTRKLLDITPHSLRGWFMAKLEMLDPGHSFQLYSLRRGGATAEFLEHRSVERAMLKGRWRDLRTFMLYLKEPAALRLADSYSGSKLARELADKFKAAPFG